MIENLDWVALRQEIAKKRSERLKNRFLSLEWGLGIPRNAGFSAR
jgi:hypothetical protein